MTQALYRRYRSQTFDELIGQEHIVRTLRNAIVEGRLGHAYLFTGPRGVGKTTVARLLAKAVNCLRPAEERPCGACESCVAIADGRAVDVIEMDAASHTSVEDAREIIEKVQFRPSSSRYKVYIIDEVHMLSTAAFNALLKTLEEPPDHAIFILATTEIHKVPATILSRCQRFTFSRHTVPAISAHLREVAASEQVALEAGVPEAIARAATGSMRDALSVLDQLMSYGGGLVSLAQVRSLLGASERQEVSALTEALLAAELSAALHVIAEVVARGADLRQFTRDLVEQLRAIMLLRAGADAGLLDGTDEEIERLQQQAASADLAALVRWTRLFGELDHQLRTTPYGQLPLELAVVECIAVPAHSVVAPGPTSARTAAAPMPPAASTANRRPLPAPAAPPQAAPSAIPTPPQRQAPVAERAPDAVAQRAPAPEMAAPEIAAPDISAPEMPAPEMPAPEAIVSAPSLAANVAPSAAGVVAADGHALSDAAIESANAEAEAFVTIETMWPMVIRDVRVQDKTVQALLNSGVTPVDVRDGAVILQVDNEWIMTRIAKSQPRQVIEKVLAKLTGIPYRIECLLGSQPKDDQALLRDQILASHRDPLVRAALNIFDADVIGVEQAKE